MLAKRGFRRKVFFLAFFSIKRSQVQWRHYGTEVGCLMLRKLSSSGTSASPMVDSNPKARAAHAKFGMAGVHSPRDRGASRSIRSKLMKTAAFLRIRSIHYTFVIKVFFKLLDRPNGPHGTLCLTLQPDLPLNTVISPATWSLFTSPTLRAYFSPTSVPA
jgi:hypothetical protein